MAAGHLGLVFAALAEDVDRAPVGEVRHREHGDPAQRLLVVERAGEHLAGVGDEPQRLAGGQDRLVVGLSHRRRVAGNVWAPRDGAARLCQQMAATSKLALVRNGVILLSPNGRSRVVWTKIRAPPRRWTSASAATSSGVESLCSRCVAKTVQSSMSSGTFEPVG